MQAIGITCSIAARRERPEALCSFGAIVIVSGM
jgi:hypothetical protein